MILGDWFWDLPSCLNGGMLHLVSSVSTFWGCAEKSEEIWCFMTSWLEPRQQATVSLEDDLTRQRLVLGEIYEWLQGLIGVGSYALATKQMTFFLYLFPLLKNYEGASLAPSTRLCSLVRDFNLTAAMCCPLELVAFLLYSEGFFFRDIRNQHLMRFGSIKSGCNYSVLFSVVF